jgi:hypothetical protein
MEPIKKTNSQSVKKDVGWYARCVEEFESFVVFVPRREVWPKAVGEDRFEILEGFLRGIHALSGAGEGACG